MQDPSLKKVGKLKIETIFLVKIQEILIRFNHKTDLLSNHNLFEEVNKWFTDLVDILDPYE